MKSVSGPTGALDTQSPDMGAVVRKGLGELKFNVPPLVPTPAMVSTAPVAMVSLRTLSLSVSMKYSLVAVLSKSHDDAVWPKAAAAPTPSLSPAAPVPATEETLVASNMRILKLCGSSTYTSPVVRRTLTPSGVLKDADSSTPSAVPLVPLPARVATTAVLGTKDRIRWFPLSAIITVSSPDGA
jgi:hypothetical protein